jgi:YD repeat-containing protein
MLKTISAFLLLSICFIGCNKGDDASNGNALLSKVTNDDETRMYQYDQQNRLIKIERIGNDGILYADSITYDGNGRLQNSITKDRVIGMTDYYYTYLRNDKGQIIRKFGTKQNGAIVPNDHSYAYDDKGRVIADTAYYQQTNSIVSYFVCRYDANNNISEPETYDMVNPNNQGTTTYQYDTKRNPYHLQGSDYFFVTNSINYLIPNNVISANNSQNIPVTIQIEYNNLGLPISMKTKYGSGTTGSPSKLEYR